MKRNLVPYVVTALLVAALAVYFVLLGSISLQLMQQGNAVSIGLGVGILVLPLLGIWSVVTTVKAGLDHQRLAARMREDGQELDVSDLPRRPSGRIVRDAADELFAQVKTEWEADPDNWRTNYRVARAYDYAGDRKRARATMRRAVALERAERVA
ncbi:MAG: hypothetical protein LLG14_10460 [Nocardiaceae bacterium]|nr:hypothetical protein [Nocardiaceae bacterium]